MQEEGFLTKPGIKPLKVIICELLSGVMVELVEATSTHSLIRKVCRESFVSNKTMLGFLMGNLWTHLHGGFHKSSTGNEIILLNYYHIVF